MIQLKDMDAYATGRLSPKGRGDWVRSSSMQGCVMKIASYGFRQWCLACLAFLAVLAGGQAWAADRYEPSGSAAIEGDWLVASRDAVIRIEQVGDQYQGYILWQLHNTYGPEDGPELNGKIVTDRNNPDPALRSQPLTGLRLLKGLSYDAGNGKWTGGRVYNSENGKTYNCLVRLLGPNRLQLHGYIGISLLGGNTVWSRVTMRNPVAGGGLPFEMVVPDK
ncbi:DUF2147 domain-containing protein [Dyella acidiphila]|uniref:DUF2147 domain-containing protein n=1 Tax=Dyella acidiphila TaxID=2775866 RepID=A0ABR9G5M5_9GAMM|nr:DUF2147 domain-containing protein [Dyella acidiphila]MBE1159337.1 DUF2147 domain-containing protein [Dyella acidiphila]